MIHIIVIPAAMKISPLATVVICATFILAENIENVPPLPASGFSVTPKSLSDGFVSVKNGNLYSQGRLWNFASFNSPHLLGAAPFEVNLIQFLCFIRFSNLALPRLRIRSGHCHLGSLVLSLEHIPLALARFTLVLLRLMWWGGTRRKVTGTIMRLNLSSSTKC